MEFLARYHAKNWMDTNISADASLIMMKNHRWGDNQKDEIVLHEWAEAKQNWLAWKQAMDEGAI